MDQLERTIHELVLRVAREKSPAVAGIVNGQALSAALGLDSLDLARIIAVLELELGVDPFASAFAVTDMRTVGDLCRAYRTALCSPGKARSVFESSIKRADARRGAQPPAEPPTIT